MKIYITAKAWHLAGKFWKPAITFREAPATKEKDICYGLNRKVTRGGINFMDNIAYITGTSRGIGRALAEALLDDGWSVTGISRQKTLEHPEYKHLALDISAPWQQWLPQIFANHQEARRLLLINNAATLGEVGYMGHIAPEAVAAAIALNVTAPALLMNEFIKCYPKQQKLVLNISSGAGQYPVDGWSIYCSSKAALDMLTEVGAHETELIKRNNLQFFSVSPGVVDTGMQEQIRHTDKKAFSRVVYFQQLKSGKRLADPAEVARQLMMLVNHPKEFKAVKQDVRKME
ncbi:short-chain dehydrogenase/reductase sdr [Flammeovirgaceae bacterium 311]|nr:short-chain dehydrogenase/reductase sdr [Flammeovirgaceae bacterium 311]